MDGPVKKNKIGAWIDLYKKFLAQSMTITMQQLLHRSKMFR